MYQRLLRLRQDDEILQTGDLQLLEVPDPVLAYDRVSPAGRRRVLANFGDEPVDDVKAGDWTVVVATRRQREGSFFDGHMDAAEAVVLRPAT
jgi:hypothetical protein